MRKAALAFTVCVVLTGSISAGPQGASNQQVFTSPTGAIACVYTPAQLGRPGRADVVAEIACERAGPQRLRLTLPATGAPRTAHDPADVPPATRTRLAYNTVWIGGPFACESLVGGVTCTRSDGQKINVPARPAAGR